MAARPAILRAIAASGRQYSSLFRPPPRTVSQKHTEVLAFVELLAQLVSSTFVDDIGELVRSHYPSQNICLLDDVLATFVLHHPEHALAVVHAVLSCVIDGTLLYDQKDPPFEALVSLFSPCIERDFTEKWALACGEILRLLTHYNRPILKANNVLSPESHSSPSTSGQGRGSDDKESSGKDDRFRRAPSRQLTPWITDSLLAADHPLRNDYFRWCGGVIGQYASGEELRPPTIVGEGKSPQLLQSAPRWAVANGAAVILSVCDDEVARHGSADLTGAAVPALLIRPPPPTIQDEHSMALGVPPLEPYAPLFHRYYANASPRATQRLLLGLLETPPHGILVTVALVNILKGADDSSSSVKLPYDWFLKHFLSPAVAAFATKPGIVADEAAALLYHIFSQPSLLVPAPSRSHGPYEPKLLYGGAMISSGSDEAIALESQAIEDSAASDLAAIMARHGPGVELRICALWDAALGLQSLNPAVVELPRLVHTPPLQPPALSWNMVRPLLRTLEHLPQESESSRCLRRLYTATVRAMLQRTFPQRRGLEQTEGTQNMSFKHRFGAGAIKAIGMAELRAMVHCLFTETSLSPILVAQLLSDALILCLKHDTQREASLLESVKTQGGSNVLLARDEKASSSSSAENPQKSSGDDPTTTTNRGAVATFDSYVVAAVCALACEVRMLSFSPSCFQSPNGALAVSGTAGLRPPGQKPSPFLSGKVSLGFATVIMRRLGLLERLLTEPHSSLAVDTGVIPSTTQDFLGNSVVAVHLSNLIGRSKACLHSLTEIMKCEWDRGICAQAAALVARLQVDSNCPLKDKDTKSDRATLEIRDSTKQLGSENGTNQSDQTCGKGPYVGSSPVSKSSSGRERFKKEANGQRQKNSNVSERSQQLWGQVAALPLEASDVTALLCRDRWNCPSAVVTNSLIPWIVEKRQVAIDIVALLCKRLFLFPELPIGVEATSYEPGWHKVVEALCSIVTVLPEDVTPFVVAQADTHLQPWTSNEHLHIQKSTFQVNGRILNLLSSLLRIPSAPYVVRVVVQDRSLLHRATDGLTIDGEACVLPQLELLEAGAVAAQASLKWTEPYEEIADTLFTFLKERLPATVRCLSHSSARVRAMSIARLRDTFRFEFRCSHSVEDDLPDEEKPACDFWRTAVEKCITWEAHYHAAGGTSMSLLMNAANALGYSISKWQDPQP